MARATLLLDVDTTPARSALGDLRGSARSAQASLTAEARKGERERERVMREEGRAAQRAAADASRARVKAERDSTRAAQQAERERTRNAEKSAADRLRIERDETRKKDRESREATRNADRAEKERTKSAERESAKRVRADERETRQRLALATRRARELGGRIASGAGTAARAVYGGAVAMHGQFQDARERRASGERTLGNAVRNANPNATRQEQNAARDAVRQFVHDTGMNFGDVSNALMEGQAHGSSLQAEGGETTADALRRSLATIREANAEGADPGQYLAARGRLASTGMTGDALKTAMRFSLGAAQAGQVEVDQIIGAGLPGASRLMASRVGALSRGTGETDEAFEARRQQTRLDAWRESVSTQEVLAASGGNAGHTSNTLASLQNFVDTPRRQEMALNNIKVAESQINTATPEGRARAAQMRSLYEGDNALFEHDPTRTGNAMRLRSGVSVAELATRVTTATGGNAQMGANIFAGGGHGNAQALLAPMRSLMAVLGGEQGQRIQTMMQGSGVTDAQIANHQRDVEGDSLSTLTRNQEDRDNALTDNTSWLKNLSDSIHDWSVRNPAASTALDGAGGVVGSIGGAFALNAIKNTAARALLPGAVGAATGAGGGAGILAALGGTVGAASAGTIGAVVAGSAGVGGALGTLVNRAIYSDRTGVGPGGRVSEAGGQAAYTNPFTADFWTGLTTSISQAVHDGMGSATVVAEVPIHTAIHARAAGTR